MKCRLVETGHSIPGALSRQGGFGLFEVDPLGGEIRPQRDCFAKMLDCLFQSALFGERIPRSLWGYDHAGRRSKAARYCSSASSRRPSAWSVQAGESMAGFCIFGIRGHRGLELLDRLVQVAAAGQGGPEPEPTAWTAWIDADDLPVETVASPPRRKLGERQRRQHQHPRHESGRCRHGVRRADADCRLRDTNGRLRASGDTCIGPQRPRSPET